MKIKIFLILLCIAFLGMACFFGFRMIREAEEYRIGTETYESLSQYVQLPGIDEGELLPPMTTAAAGETPKPKAQEQAPEPAAEEEAFVDFEALQAINPEVTAWIHLEGTVVSYPVVQGGDNSSYLKRMFDGQTNSAGSIFMDYRNDRQLADRNTVFYGHNMRNGSMFAAITQYRDQAFYEAHPTGLVVTPKGSFRLEFIAGYVTDMNSQAWKIEFATDEEFIQWLQEAKGRSDFQSPVEPQRQDRVVTLSTCTYEYDDARYVLVGIVRE